MCRVKTSLCRYAFLLSVFVHTSTLYFLSWFLSSSFLLHCLWIRLPFLLQSTCLAFSFPPLIVKDKFSWLLSQRSKPLSEAENQNTASAHLREKREEMSMAFRGPPGTHWSHPGQPGVLKCACTTCSESPWCAPSAEAKLELQFATLHGSLHTPKHTPRLHLPLWPAEWPLSLWAPDLYMVITWRTMYSQQLLRRDFVHFSSCVPALALSYHATLGPE